MLSNIKELDIGRLIIGELRKTSMRPVVMLPTTESQRKVLTEFNEFCKATQKSIGRRYELIRFLRNWITKNIKKEFDDILVEDLQKYFANLNQIGKNKNSIKVNEVNLKQFLKWYYRGKENRDQLDDMIGWMQGMNNKNRDTKNREEQKELKFVSLEMVEKMLPHCKMQFKARDQAILIALFESGYRSKEFLSLKIGDIKVSATGMIFNNPNLRTSMTLTKGQTFIEKWLDYHPDRNNPKAPLWCTNTGNKMGYENLSRIIKSIGNAAGYDGVRPHLYRHGYATFWSSKVPENMLAKMLGHSDTSAVQKYYVHLRMEDARKKQAEIEGKEIVEKEEMESILSPVICTTCTKINSHGAVFCAGCGDPLTEVGENKREGQIKDLKDSIAELKHLYNTQKTPDAYIEELALLRKENKRLNAKMVMLNKQMVSREELIELIKSRT